MTEASRYTCQPFHKLPVFSRSRGILPSWVVLPFRLPFRGYSKRGAPFRAFSVVQSHGQAGIPECDGFHRR